MRIRLDGNCQGEPKNRVEDTISVAACLIGHDSGKMELLIAYGKEVASFGFFENILDHSPDFIFEYAFIE